MSSDERYWVQKNDNYTLFLEDLRKNAQNFPGWLSYFAPHKNYKMRYENSKDIHGILSFWNINMDISLDLNKALKNRSSVPVNKLTNDWTETEILFLLNKAISDGTRLRKNGGNEGQNIPLRNYPSGGAEYPISTYLLFNKNIGIFKKNQAYLVHGDVGEITKQPINNKNIFKNAFAVGQFNKKLSEQMDEISFATIFSMNLKYSFPKYRTFSRQLAFIEAGHIAQNIQLICSAMGKASICSGGVLNDKSKEMLGIIDDDTFIIYGVFVG